MSSPTDNKYLETQVLTASPEQLHLMLYDGAIRFSERGLKALHENKFDEMCGAMERAQRIVLELASGLRHEVEPDLCGKMASLYNFIYRKLVEGNLKRDGSCIEDALKILHYQRETWVLLMGKLTADGNEPSDAVDVEPAESTGLCIDG